MKEIYIVRHGQTDYNLKRIVQGRGVNAPINEKGRQQAKAFYDRFRLEGFQHIFTSSLLRTEQTVQLFIEDGIPFSAHPELDEMDWGVHEGREATTVRRLEFKKALKNWTNGDVSHAVEGGESPVEVSERLRSFLQMLETRQEEKVLIAMHGRALRIMLCTMLQQPLENMENFGHGNLCLYKLQYSKSGSGSVYQLMIENELSHLRELM